MKKHSIQRSPRRAVTGQQNILSATQIRTGAAAGSLTTGSVYVGNVQAAPYNHMQVALYTYNALS